MLLVATVMLPQARCDAFAVPSISFLSRFCCHAAALKAASRAAAFSSSGWQM